MLAIETAELHGLAAGDQIDYYTEAGKFSRQEVAEVLSETTFRVKASTAPQKLFVFGKGLFNLPGFSEARRLKKPAGLQKTN